MSGRVGDLSPNQALALEQVSIVHMIHIKLQLEISHHICDNVHC